MARTVSGPPRRPGQPGRAGGGPRPGKRKRRGAGPGGKARAPGLLHRLHRKSVLFALTALVITVQLRKPLFALPVHGGYALVDAFGVNVRDVTGRPPGLPLLTVNTNSGTLRNSPAVRAAAAVLAELPQQAARQVRGVTTGGPNDVSVQLANGAIVIWGGAEQGSVKAAELQVLMRRHARVYDVSGAGTAVTKG